MLDEMTAFIKRKMQEMSLSEDLIAKAVNSLPYLNRRLVKTPGHL